MKTVIFGFDALDFRYLDRYRDSLPNITALRERGLEAPLESTHPPWTGSAWPSMYTGTDPSHHGVYGFFRYDGYPDEGALVSRTDVAQPALWDYSSQESIPSVVMNVPVTHPATPIEGTLLPGYLAHEAAEGYPKSVRQKLETHLGEPYRIYSANETADDPERKFAGYLDLIDLRRRAALAVLSNTEWELAVLQVQKTDAVFHNFETDDHFRATYEAADRLVGDVLEAVDDDVTAILCSDHGMGPVTGYMIYINEILRQHGFLEAVDTAETETNTHLTLESEKGSLLESESEPPDTGNETQTKSHTGLSAAIDHTLPHAVRTLERVGIAPDDIYALASRLGLEEALVSLTPESVRNVAAEEVDWRRSQAYCSDPTRLGIRLNVVGREAEGVVSNDAYEPTRTAIIDLLSDLQTPDGKPAFEWVCRREERYEGPHTDAAPDILFRPTDMNHKLSTTLYGRQFVPVDVFDHKVDGTFVATGPTLSDRKPDRLSLTDIAPIAMAALEQPIPDRMTGRVPDGLFVDSVSIERKRYDGLEYPGSGSGSGLDGPGERDRSKTEADEAAVTERLEDLGYL